MRTEAAVRPKFRDVFEGKRSALKTDAQVSSVRDYHAKVSAGTIFGARTERLLPNVKQDTGAITEYFNRVEAGFESLNEAYGLQDAYGEKFDFIQNEATRLMWVYGIDPGMLKEHQRGLLLLGTAATLVDLHGKRGAAFTQEKRRMHHAVRMLAQSGEGTFSTKVNKWVSEYTTKAHRFAETGDHRKRDIMRNKAYQELQYTTPDNSLQQLDEGFVNEATERFERELQVAIENKDEEKSSEIGSHTPHIQRINDRLSIPQTPDSDIEWVVTVFDPSEFQRRFSAPAVSYGRTLVFANDIYSASSIGLQQHEYLHSKMSSTSTPYLGLLQDEADAERNTDVPAEYPYHRLVSYFVDDTIDLHHLGSDHAPIAQTRAQAALRRKERVDNPPEDVAWNRALINAFGLEGYLTYYLTHDKDGTFPEQVEEQLLDIDLAAYRLTVTSGISDRAQDLPYGFYTGTLPTQGLTNSICDIWNQSTGINVWEKLITRPETLLEELSYDQLAEFSRRIEASLFSEDLDLNRESIIKQLNIKKTLWRNKGFPILPDSFYLRFGSNDGESEENFKYKEMILQFSHEIPIINNDTVRFVPPDTELASGQPFVVDDFRGGMYENHIRPTGESFLTPLPGENGEAVYLSFVHTLSQAVNTDSSLAIGEVHDVDTIRYDKENARRISLDETKNLTPEQKLYAEAVLFSHHQIFSEENGNLSQVIERIKSEILQPLALI